MKSTIKIINTPKLIPVPTTVYITEDGKEFTHQQNAMVHEDYLNKEKVFNEKYKVRKVDWVDEYDIAIYIPEMNDEVKKDMYNKFYHLDSSFWKETKSGWYTFYTDDSGDYTNSYYRNVEDYIKQLERDIQTLKDLK